MKKFTGFKVFTARKEKQKSESLNPTVEKKRKALKASAMETASKFGLTKTGDRIEDYGEHSYGVFKHDKSWIL